MGIAINRHLSSVRSAFNLFADSAFNNANKVLDGVLKERKRQEQEPAVDHKEAITNGDLEKLDLYFADINRTEYPRKLAMYVWYVLTTHFCLRGGEVQSKLTQFRLDLHQP